MFQDCNQNSFNSGILNKVSAPRVYNFNSENQTSGLNKATAAFTIINSNCDKACVSALDVKNKNTLNNLSQFKFNSCVRKCFVERFQEHFQDDKEFVSEFLLASAFEYGQKDIHNLSLNDVLRTQAPKNKRVYTGLEGVSDKFNNYFS